LSKRTIGENIGLFSPVWDYRDLDILRAKGMSDLKAAVSLYQIMGELEPEGLNP
jgi:hypothetical protein